jgi:gliding motility-associated-like protein
MFTIPSMCSSECVKFVSATTFRKDTFFGWKEIGNHKTMKSYLLFLLTLVSLGKLYAQTTQDWCTYPGAATGGFTVNGSNSVVRGCVPFEVTIQNTAAINDKYIYDYKGGDPVNSESVRKHTYQKRGTYRILQVGSGTSTSGGTGSVFCQVVEVYDKPNFTLKACSGRKVQVTIPDDSTTQRYDEFIINWGSGITSKVPKGTTMVASYTYPTSALSAAISVSGSVSGQALGCSKSSSVILSTTNLSTVAIRKVTTRTDGTVDVLIKGSQGATAEVQIDEGTGSFKNTGQLMTTNDTISINLKNIDATKNTYCFRLSANDGCDNAAVTSNVVCSINLDVVAQDRQNALAWKEYPTAATFQSYKITRNGANLGAAIANRLTTSTIDRNVTCGDQYCYQVTATVAGGAESVSPLRCVKAISNETPSLVQNPVVSVLEEEQKVEVRISNTPRTGGTPSKFKIIYLRADNGSNDYKEVAVQENSLSFIDQTTTPADQSYCYKIQYENACGNRSEPTEPICSIRLYSKTNSTVDWTPESPFLVPINRYELEILNEQGGLVDQVSLGGNTNFNPDQYNPDQQLFRYRILAYAQGVPQLSYSNFYVFTRDALVFVPDAFSPNGDTVNDTFFAKGQFVDKARMIIYNRWGQALFETEEALDPLKGWTGEGFPEGTYVYRLEVTDLMGKGFVKTGTLLLAR